MIINIISRSHVGAALEYGARVGHWATPDGPAMEIPGTLPLGTSLMEWEKEFKRVSSLRPEIKKNIVHIIVAFAEEDRKLDPNHLASIGQEVLEKLGYDDCVVRWAEHVDGQTQHLHAVVSAISHTGERIDRTGDRWRGQKISRLIELENGLCRVSNIKGGPVLAPLPIPGQDIATVVPPPPGWTEEVVARVRQVFRPGCTLQQLRNELAPLGVSLEIRWTKDGSKIQGLGFRFAGEHRTASKTDKSFSLAGFIDQGLDFVAARDIPKLASPVEGPPAALAVAKIPTLSGTVIPQIAVAQIAPTKLPPPLPHIPEVPHVPAPRLKASLLQSAFTYATQLAARIWRAVAAPGTPPTDRQPALPGR